ncbi:hypothetical protein NQ176_g4610 [Zarea fungicola]|uniref:Uncharacterized protein n=1 Tax=Zarea fungicola TaxID=93591 RepID=A0ACC1ND86_9HYPO|nr:hypothetical protein NQ176_g4610 [Lecanicillium fungicola]
MTREIVQNPANEIHESSRVEKENEQPPTSGDHKPAGGAPSKPPLLCLGAPRTGTTSLSQALEILGVAPIHHGMQHTDDEELDWEVFNRAADATFPTIPSYTGKAFSRSDWDELCSRYAAVTDVASYYAVSLIAAYPDAKVILVERDVDSWLKSIHAIFGMWENPITDWAVSYIGPRSGSIKAEVARKYHLGWTQSSKTSDIMGNAKSAYERHYKEIRKLVPPEQLLDFKLKDGWGPLCKFLDKPIPQDVDFPRANDSASYKAFVQRETNISLFNAVKNTLLWRELKRA